MTRRALFLALTLGASLDPAFAAERLPDKITVTLGGYAITRYESTVALSNTDLGAGVFISPEDTLGLDNEQTVARLSGRYRFSGEHALTFAWYRISSDGDNTLEQEIDWIDEEGNPITIPVGARVESSLDYEIFKLAYLWSFHHTDKVELAAGAGLHLARVSVGLDVSKSGSGADAKDAGVTLPLPVVSFSVNYWVTPRLSWGLRGEAFSLEFENTEGVYTDVTLGMEYRFTRHIGLGVGIASNSLSVVEVDSNERFSFDNRISGLLLYTAAYF